MRTKQKTVHETKAPVVFSGHITSARVKALKTEAGKGARLASLDFYRGMVMFFLILDYAGVYRQFRHLTAPGSFMRSVAIQFTHHPWHGLHLWDFVQPGFMFIAGVALAFSLTKQTSKGKSWGQQAKHALRRSWWLLFWGILVFAVRGDHLILDLTDVLTQLAVTLLLAFLIYRWKTGYQILFTAGLLLLTAFLYRYTDIPGFDQPFTNFHNFGNYFDLLLTGRMNSGGWVSINYIPTAAHTIWGAIAGKWLLSLPDNKRKLKHIIVFGIVLLILGYGLDRTGITPIIKRIATASFTLATGGWCLLILAFLYWWIDVLQHKRYITFFVIIGMNSIFIYLFCQVLVGGWLRGYTYTIVTNVLEYIAVNSALSLLIASIVLFGIEWYVCYWLYKKKIFFKV